MIRALLAVLALCAGLAAWAVHSERITVPAHWNPWAPLNVAEPPNWLTGYKLGRTVSDPLLCTAALAGSSLQQRPAPDRDAANGCGWQAAVVVSDPRFAPGFTLTCAAAVSLVMWERHALQPAALTHLGQPVARVEHFGSYACRNVRGPAGEGARRSQHARANALDVSGFQLSDGSRISLVRHWDGDDPQSRFLRAARDGACRFFKGTLGPDYNAAHNDHFHLDRGPYRICR